ncbi:MAG TPA: hypothetical protein DCL08_08100 [Anaerolineaceae bacterium]|jgi:hypothetical protein|nr:MAG: RNA polymerase sigma factor [Anaerolineaceae bacterium 46_22]HAF49180.1 hypothetical protein [Anaerolineaceae bacterium]
MVSQSMIDKEINEGNETSPIANLFKLGREKSFVSYEDILRHVPFPEQDLEYVDRIFACLICAGISYGEDEAHQEDIDGLYDKAELNGTP